MTKKFNLLQLFSLVDGRLSTTMDDVYSMLNHICDDESLMTHHLPVAMNYIKEKNPTWFSIVKNTYDTLGCNKETDFKECVKIIESNNETINIPQLKDEFDTSDFVTFMVDNSLLLKRMSNV